MVLALFIGATVLPSALNLPQPNPSTVLEYAPIPPDDETPPSSEGSISSLGLGGSSTLNAGAKPDVVEGTGSVKTVARFKDCVEHNVSGKKELKQTEDPQAPPCVPFFDGDNGGATWQGVTGDEITVAIYQATYISDQEREGSDTSAGESTPSGGICDIHSPDSATNPCSDPNTGEEHSVVIATKALSKYFNERFQTYGRRIHFYIYWASCGAPCPSSARRSQASDIWEQLKPFAVIDKAFFGGNNDDFAESIARRKTSVYGSFGVLPNDFYRKLAPYFWSFYPDVEHWADSYVNYVCTKVAGTPVTYADGEDEDGTPLNGQKRRYAIMHTTDPTYPGLKRFKELAEPAIRQCLAGHDEQIVETVTFPYAGYAKDFGDPKQQRYGVDNVAKMRDAKVNTILWFGGMEAKTTPAAYAAQWFPEWVIAGDLVIDDLINGREQQQDVFAHARVVTKQLREDDFSKTPGRVAFRYANPNGRQIHEYYANLYYRDFFTMFKAIQVAGPKLTPYAVDTGQHLIPRVKSTSPFVAACFYDPGDFSCVKDAHVAWWDSSAPDPNGEAGNGCWRMVQGGQRYLATDWSGVTEPFVSGTNDPCNGVKGAVYNRL